MLNDIRPGLREFLLADGAIFTAVGGVRIHGMNLPMGVMPGPSIVYTQISEGTDHTNDGPSGLVASRFQIDAWADTYDEATLLALQIKEHLDGYRGPMGSTPVQGVFAEDARSNYDPNAALHRVSRDYFISYEER